MNLKTLAAALALPVALAACAPEVESTIYVADIVNAVETGEAISVPAVLRIPQGGEDECRKGLDALIEKLATLAPVTGKGQCISKDQHGQGTQLAEIETELQIVPSTADIEEPNLFILETATTDEGRIDLTLRMLEPIETVIKALQAENPAQVDFEPSFFLLNFNNDTSGSVEMLVNHVFVDDEPSLVSDDPVTLRRRDSIAIRFSDVASSYVEDGNAFWFATLTAAP